MSLKKTTVTVTAFAILAGCLVGTGINYTKAEPARAATEPGFSASGKAALSSELNGSVTRGDTPGVVALVTGSAGVLWEGAAGELDVAGGVPMPVDGIFSIASMTKPVTSVAIMMLLDQGKLKLDDSVSKYLDGFDNLEVITKFNDTDATYETRPAKGPITIRHLLTHTSGIGYRFTNPIEKRLTEATKKSEWELPLLSDPGAEWHYSASTNVLGRVVEKITGTPLEDYYQQHIFKPLGMLDTSYAVPVAKQSRVPVKYIHVNGGFQAAPRATIPSAPTPPYRGDGGLYSTVEDYAKLMRMILNGGRAGSVRILSESSVKMMGENNIGAIFVTLQPDADKRLTKPFPLGAGHDKFGLGFQIASNDPQYAAYRSPGSMSWAGILNTEFWIDPVKKIGGVQMMQVAPFYDDGAIRTLRDFEKSVYQNLQ
jgi:methyl acetate hydrolase